MILKILRYSILSTILLIILALAAMQIQEVKLFAFSKLAEVIEEETGVTITVQSLELMLPFEVKATSLNVVDKQGNQVEANRAVFRINPAALFRKELYFHSISLNGVTVTQGKEIENTSSSAEGVSLDFDQIPLYVSIPQFYAQNLVVQSSQYPEISDIPVDVKAHFLMDPHNKALSLGVKVIDRRDSSRFLAADVDLLQEEANVLLDLSIYSSSDGFIHLPEDSAFEVNTHLVAELETWQKLITKDSSEQRVLGDLHIQYDMHGKEVSEVTGNIYLSTQHNVEISDITGEYDKDLFNGELHYSAEGKFDGTQLSIDIPDMSPYGKFINKEMSGAANLSLTVSGAYHTPSFHLSLKSDQLEIEDASLSKVDLELSGTYYPSSCIDASVKFHLDDHKNPLDMASSVRWCMGNMIDISGLQITLPKTSIHGDLSYTISTNELDGSINGKIDDLSVLENFFPYTFDGKVRFDAYLNHGETSGQSVEMSLTSDHASVNSFSIDGLNSVISISDAYGHPDGLIDLTIQKLALDDSEFEKIHLTNHINETQKIWPFEVSFGGNTLSAKGEGYWGYDDKSLNFTIDDFSGVKAKHAFSLAAPISLVISENKTDLSKLMINVNDGFLEASLNIDENSSIDSSLKLVDIPLSFLSTEIYSQPFDGMVTACIDINGTEDQLFGEAYADFSELTFKNIDQLGDTPTNASVKAHLSTEGATFKGLLYGPGGTPIDIDASLPIKLMLRAPIFHIDTDAPIAVTLKASGTVTPIFELFAAEDFVFTGDGDIQVDINGTLLSPTVTGKASIFNGSLESFVFGTLLHNIQATFQGEGQRIVITSFSATDHKSGSLEGSGYLGLQAKENYPFDLKLNLDDLRLVRLDNTKASFDGQLHIQGNSEQIDIGGSVVSGKITHKIAKKIDEITETVEVTYINQDPNEIPPTKITKPQFTKVPTNLNLNVSIPPGSLSVTDDDLTSTWGGDILVEGALNKLKLKGEIKLDNGGYLLNGQMYDLTNGAITMAGNPERKTTIYVVASRDINDYRVDIVLQGKITNPNIILRSRPALPQQEILSLILFGEAPTEISHTQDQQLERSLSSLTKDQSGPGVINKLQKSIGIDRIDINRQELDDREEMSIQIGKYITKDIFISLNKGFGDEPTRVAVEAKLQKNLKVQVDAGESTRGSDSPASGQVSLIWKHDY